MTLERNQPDQDEGAGEVFVNITEKERLPGFGFLQPGGIGAWPSQKTASGEKRTKTINFGGSRVGGL
jgi:hypothetical protein